MSEILRIRSDLYPFLLNCLYGDMDETLDLLTDDLWGDFHQILSYVPAYILVSIIATVPDSDITIILCLHPETNHQTLYALWKKNKAVPHSLTEDQWLEIMGRVKHQGEHDICWAVVVAEIVRVVRVLDGRDPIEVQYSFQDVVDFTWPEERRREKHHPEKQGSHYCYPLYVQRGLEYVQQSGIQREEDRPFQVICNRHVPPRMPSALGYIGEVVPLQSLEEALEVLKTHPVAAAMPIFSPDYMAIGDKIYNGPTQWNSQLVCMHAVNLIGAAERNGEKFVKVRSSHGEEVGVNGNLKISMETMMVCLNRRRLIPDADDYFYSQPFPLLSSFVYPKLLSREEEEARKKNDKLFKYEKVQQDGSSLAAATEKLVETS